MIQRRPLNVLLLLSSRQSPPPEVEIRTLADESKDDPDGVTYFVTTRYCADKLVSGESSVAFFGDIGQQHKVFGRATYVDWIDIWDPAAQKILAQHPLYQDRNIPDTAVGLLTLKDIQFLTNGRLEDLQGLLAEGSKLDYDAVRHINSGLHASVFGTRISSIYYLDATGGPPSTSETLALLEAKKEELEEKVWDYAERWQKNARDRDRVQRRLHETTRKFEPILAVLRHDATAPALATISNAEDDDVLSAFRVSLAVILCDGKAAMFEWLLAQPVEVLTSAGKLKALSNANAQSLGKPSTIELHIESLKRAIWKAQCISILPELDRIRRDLITRDQSLWEEFIPHPAKYNDKTHWVRDVARLDYGHLLRISNEQKRRGDARFQRYSSIIYPFYNMRNRLSHPDDPLTAEELRQVAERSLGCIV